MQSMSLPRIFMRGTICVICYSLTLLRKIHAPPALLRAERTLTQRLRKVRKRTAVHGSLITVEQVASHWAVVTVK